MSKFLNETGVAHLWAKVKALVASALASLHYAGSDEAGGAATMALALPQGSIDATSTSTVLTATVPGITELREGVCCVLYNNGKTSASGCTLNVNGLGAKPVYMCTGSARVTTQITAAYTSLFIYRTDLNNGAGGWRLGQIHNTNTTYSVIPTAELQAGTARTGRIVTAARLHQNYSIDDDGTINIAGRSITPLTEHQDISGKQDQIPDLADIRAGAALGATALQAHQPLKTINGQPITGTGNIDIDATVSASFTIDPDTGHLLVTTS